MSTAPTRVSEAADDVVAHKPMLQVGLRWLLHTEQPAAAIVSPYGQQLPPVDDRALRVIPTGWAGHPEVVVEAAGGHKACPPSWTPRNPVRPAELAAFTALLGCLGEQVVATFIGQGGVTASLVLASPAQPSLRAAVDRYRAGCPSHGGDVFCRCTWYRAGARQAVSVADVQRQVLSQAARTAPAAPAAVGLPRWWAGAVLPHPGWC